MTDEQKKAPVDHEAERAVAAFLLAQGENDPGGVDAITGLVGEQDFNHPQWRSVMQAVEALRNDSATVSTAAVAGVLHDWGVSRPSHQDMARLIIEVSAGRATAETHARRLRDLRRWRGLLELGESFRASWERGGSSLRTIVEQGLGDLGALMSEDDLPYVSMASAMRERTHALKEANGKPVRRVLTGFHPIDNLTGGFGEGEMDVLAAPTAGGKTAMALYVADLLAHGGVPSLIASGEMQAHELSDRVMSRVCRLDGIDIRDNNLAPDDLANMADRSRDEAYARIFVMERKGAMTVQRIAQTARTIQRQHGLGIIIVDYLQIMSVIAGRFDQGRTREAEVASVSRGLKALAGELSVPVLALSQFSRAYLKDRREPELHDLRESGAVEQDANQVLFLYPTNPEDPSTLKLRQAKHRAGEDGRSFMLGFDKAHMTFSEKKQPTVERNKQARLELQQRAHDMEINGHD